MARLQRSAVFFRRQGSSDLVSDDKLVSGELKPEEEQEVVKTTSELEKTGGDSDGGGNLGKEIKPINTTVERSKSTGEKRGYRIGKVSPTIELSFPRISACGCCRCGGFEKTPKNQRNTQKAGKRRLR